MEYRVATPDEVQLLAVMRWQQAADDGVVPLTMDEFVPRFVDWAREVNATHTPFVGVGNSLVAMAWLARVPRAPGPDCLVRANGDLQTVLVLPEHRNKGIGEGLIRAVLRYAWEHGMDAVTVAANERALSLYRRVGFRGDPHDLRCRAADT